MPFVLYKIILKIIMKGELWEVIIRNALIAAEQWKRGAYLPEDIRLSGKVIMKTEAV